MRILVLYHLVHRVPHLVSSCIVHKVAHINGAAVYELAFEVGILHQSAEQACSRICVAPTAVGVICVVIKPLYGVICRRRPIESQSEVGVLGNPAPLATLCSRSPCHDVVAREVLVVIIEVHRHQVDKLYAVHALGILCHRMSVFVIESGKLVPVVHRALFQLCPVLQQVDVLQSVVVGVDVILVRAFANVAHAVVFSVDIDYSRSPCLPVEVLAQSH